MLPDRAGAGGDHGEVELWRRHSSTSLNPLNDVLHFCSQEVERPSRGNLVPAFKRLLLHCNTNAVLSASHGY